MKWLLALLLSGVMLSPAFGQYCTGHSCDAYGGRTDWSCSNPNAPNAWSTAKVNGQWMFCTPAGHGMFLAYAYAAGPIGNYVTKYGTDTNAFELTASRLKYYGFNTLGPYTVDKMYAWNRTTKVPGIYVIQPGMYAMTCTSSNSQQVVGATWDQCIKELSGGQSMFWPTMSNNGTFDFGDTTRYAQAITYNLTQSGATSTFNSAIAGAIAGTSTYASLDYLIGIAIDDSDRVNAYLTSVRNNPFTTTLLSDYGAAYGAWWTAVMNWEQQANATQGAFYTVDPTVYTKKAWRDFLANKYSSLGQCAAQTHTGIQGLNDCWGSTYTTFDSSGTVTTGETVWTTDGVNWQAPSHTKATAGSIAPGSVKLYVDGTLTAGDCYHPGKGDTCNPNSVSKMSTYTQCQTSNSTNVNCAGIFYGGPSATLGGSIDYTAGTVLVGYNGPYNKPAVITCTAGVSCTAVWPDYANPGISAGNKITVAGFPTTCCSTSVATVSAASQFSDTFSGPFCNPYTSNAFHVTWPWSGGTVTQGGYCYGGTDQTGIAKVTVPAAGQVITMTYEVNGWGSGGTGLLDEDGRSTHSSWMGTDIYALSNANVNFKADMDAAMKSLMTTYFTTARNTMRAAFTGATVPKAPPLYLGTDTMGSWSGISTTPVLQAASGLVDAMIVQAWVGIPLTSGMLDNLNTYYGGPVIDTNFSHSQIDSQYGTNVGVNDFSTQESRGQNWYNLMNSVVSAKSTTAAKINPYAGVGFQNYSDTPASEQTNWGFLTVNDNLYDLHEDSTSAVACSAPLNTGCVGAQCIGGAYPCGGEPAYNTWSSGMSVTCTGGCGAGAAPDFSSSTRIKQTVGGLPYIFSDVTTSGPTTTSGSAPAWSCATPGTTTVTNGTDGISWLCLNQVTNASGFGDVMACNGTSNCGVTAGNQLWLSLMLSQAGRTVGSGRTIGGGRSF